MFQTNKINNTVSSILGPKLIIDGNIKVDGDLLIYGEVNGNIECKGMVNSARGSKVKGDVRAQSASINGEITGDLFINKKVHLGKGSHLDGNLQAAIITIEEGARFDGMCNMVGGEKTSKNTQSIHEAKLNPSNEQA